jgi:uroporphyrinogen III methyltransferase/synthase
MVDISTKGIVYLVGAGPGDPGLITIRGKELLDNCDIVVYDNLAPVELVVSLPDSIEKIYVGKSEGKHTLSQDEINILLVKYAKKGKTVVRLKGGDPFTFGRGGEEAKFLRNNNIEYEIVPGVTAGIAAPSYCGIPCTERNKASYVIYATGHKAKDKEVSSVPWEWLAKIKNGTLVIYMGVNEFENIATTLIEYGLSKDTPAAVIERGTYSSQRIVTSTIFHLSKKAKQENIKPPSLFIIGDVVNFNNDLAWYDNKPLSGKRIMVTRPADQAQKLYKSLRQFGGEVLPYPTIAISEHIDSAGWEAFNSIEYNPESNSNWLIFTSENGIKYFLKQLLIKYTDIRCLSNFKIAVVGSGTARILKSYHLKTDFMPSLATAKSLAEQLASNYNLKDSTIVRVKGNLVDETVENTFTKAGANVVSVNTYKTNYAKWATGLKKKLFDYPPDVILFTSGSAVKGLNAMLNSDKLFMLANNATIVSIGPSTSKIVKTLGIDVTIEAKDHSIDGVLNELLTYYETRKCV